ncbi:hypothetical protein C4K68_27545 [Pokkaliibacter plantistimulans]|uniref:DUF2066 domain-containing protein n=2 Tax=Pseudomonadota TaxID=1224 RepID=A0A2S5KHB3_9PROT|nr:hypothetical protein C4K68_27545 [Pokkaliibacter plantistimulans]
MSRWCHSIVGHSVMRCFDRMWSGMNKIKMLLHIGLLLAGCCANAHGQVIDNYVSDDQPLQVDSQDAQKTALRQGLSDVLLRQLGMKELLSNPHLVDALDHPDSYVIDFKVDRAVQSGEEGLFTLHINFDQNALNQLYKEASLVPWSRNRSSVLMWLAQEQQGQRQLVANSPLAVAMQAQAQKRGIPLFRPLMDLQDELGLSVSDAWGFFAEPIQKASSRYGAQAVLTGRVYQEQGKWTSQWQLLDRDRQMLFKSKQDSLDAIAADVVDQLAVYFAKQDKLSALQGAGAYFLSVSGIRSLDDWQALQKDLQQLSSIVSFQLDAMQGNEVRVRVISSGTIRQLQDELSQNNSLHAQAGSDEQTLNFNWQGADSP